MATRKLVIGDTQEKVQVTKKSGAMRRLLDIDKGQHLLFGKIKFISLMWKLKFSE